MPHRSNFASVAVGLTLGLTIAACSTVGTPSSKSVATPPTATTTPTAFPNAMWAGYVQTGDPGTFTSVGGEWTVPEVTPTISVQASATWIGVGGYNANQFLRIGTEQISGERAGAPGARYEVAWQCVPDLAVALPRFVLHPGDRMRATVAQAGTKWSLSITNVTTAETFRHLVDCTPDQSSAGWVTENIASVDAVPTRKSNPAVLPRLTDITFSNLTINGNALVRQDLVRMDMVDNTSTQLVAGPLADRPLRFTIHDARA